MRTGMSSNTHIRAQSPGAREAIERGCTCDPAENCAGEGRRGVSGARLFVPDQECPVHGLDAVFGTSTHRVPHQKHLHALLGPSTNTRRSDRRRATLAERAMGEAGEPRGR